MASEINDLITTKEVLSRRGQMELFSVEERSSRMFDSYVGTFTTFKIEENDDIPSTLLCLTRNPKWKFFYVYELNVKRVTFFQKKKCIEFWEALPDSTLPMQISQKYGLIYVISKLGLLHVKDLKTALPICKEKKISGDPIILTMEDTTSGGFYAINEKGQVPFTNVNSHMLVVVIRAHYQKRIHELWSEAFKISQELELKLFDTRTQLKSVEKSLALEAKRRKEIEDELASNTSNLHNLQKIQQEMLDEIEELKTKNIELQNEKDKIGRWQECWPWDDLLSLSFVFYCFGREKETDEEGSSH